MVLTTLCYHTLRVGPITFNWKNTGPTRTSKYPVFESWLISQWLWWMENYFLSAFCSKQLTKVNYAATARRLDYSIDYSRNPGNSLYVNGPIVTGNTGYSKQNWVIGKWWIPKDPEKLIQMPSAGQSTELRKHFHHFHKAN